ncbi:MAG: response regulator transcription factor [Chloroflexi bacterium]|nr:response regulator transcription factor [Chloroflexota bacterium]MBI4506346.1 response regulator transcription factor [Chloroflexota bacterium]
MRALLVDDHRLFRAGLRELLTQRGFDVVAEAADGAEALARVREAAPDLVLMDLQMPGMGGIEAIRRLKAEFPDLPVIVLTASDEDADLFETIKSGAQGYMLKSLDSDTAVDLLKGAARGEAALTPQLAARILAEFARADSLARAAGPAATPRPAAEVAAETLTAREQEVLALLVGGASNKEIARRLVVSENTIKYHLKNILQKLHLHNRAQVAAYAVRHGLTRPPVNE